MSDLPEELFEMCLHTESLSSYRPWSTYCDVLVHWQVAIGQGMTHTLTKFDYLCHNNYQSHELQLAMVRRHAK